VGIGRGGDGNLVVERSIVINIVMLMLKGRRRVGQGGPVRARHGGGMHSERGALLLAGHMLLLLLLLCAVVVGEVATAVKIVLLLRGGGGGLVVVVGLRVDFRWGRAVAASLFWYGM